jgi:asparagine synthase (glutamine-hydrolysing)
MPGYIGSIGQNPSLERTENMEGAHRTILEVFDQGSGTWQGAEIEIRYGGSNGKDVLPFTPDKVHYIVGEVRLDRNELLTKELNVIYPDVRVGMPDIHLLMYAYLAWGEACLKKIAGDFSFAVWNAEEKTLFAARDHFGVIPFYYHVDETDFYFTNFYNTFRNIPSATLGLSPSALQNYVVMGLDANFSQTLYERIKKLPPAHYLHYKEGKIETQRYWHPQRKVQTLKLEEYITRFRALLKNAVSDRIRTKGIATHLSGGMDSSSVTALAKSTLESKFPKDYDLQAFTTTFTHLISEREGQYAHIVASHVQVAHQLFYIDKLKESQTKAQDIPYMEPRGNPQASSDLLIMREAEKRNLPVILTGFGSDALFLVGFEGLLDATRFYRIHRRFPPLGLKSRLRRWLLPEIKTPQWINDQKAGQEGLKITNLGRAVGIANNPLWISIFEHGHPGFTGIKTSLRHPFFSLDLVEFLLTVPNHLLYDKYLLRLAMRPYLPASLIKRPKTLLYGMENAHVKWDHNFLERLGLKIEKHKEFLRTFTDVEELKKDVKNRSSTTLFHRRNLVNLNTILTWAENNPALVNFPVMKKVV